MTVLDFNVFDTGTPASNPTELDSTKRFTLGIKGGTFLLPQGADKIMVIENRAYVRYGESGGWLFLDQEMDEFIRIDTLISQTRDHRSVVTQVNDTYAWVRRICTEGEVIPGNLGTMWEMDVPNREDMFVLNNKGNGLLVAGRKTGPLYFPTGITEDRLLVQILGKWHAISGAEQEGRVDIDDTISTIKSLYIKVEGGDWKKLNSGADPSVIEKVSGSTELRNRLHLEVYEGILQSLPR